MVSCKPTRTGLNRIAELTRDASKEAWRSPNANREIVMGMKGLLSILIAGLAVTLIYPEWSLLLGQASSPVGLTGQVTSREEGAMEGVVVSAKKEGSTGTVSVG